MSDIRSDMKNRPDYLGDGVYASLSGGMIKLSTPRHGDRRDREDVVFLEPEVLAALIRYAERIGLDVRSMTTQRK